MNQSAPLLFLNIISIEGMLIIILLFIYLPLQKLEVRLNLRKELLDKLHLIELRIFFKYSLYKLFVIVI